ncbi:putative fanconi anaemia protein FANCD2 [Lupinus albus]|uniref:Putative fanconi anaemia protein FANCD2 n=1 Tax=Lupinus albus TaxID=3870 RepID=A0A6A4Q5V2_LUPAL|nr:putative fanconi anaemia protein FANCD2 [Lupinus albus]
MLQFIILHPLNFLMHTKTCFDVQVLASDDDQDALTTDPEELIDSEESEGINGDEEDIFRNLLSRAGFHITCGDNPSQPQVTLREKLLMDAGAIAGFLTGLRVYLDDPAKVKRLLLPTKLSGTWDGKKATKTDESSPSLMNLLMGVKVLQQAIIDLLLDIMVECCQPSEGGSVADSVDASSKPSPDSSGAATPLKCDRENGATVSAQFPVNERLGSVVEDSSSTSAVQNSDLNANSIQEKALPGQPISPPETSATGSENTPFRSKTKWPEQSEELLGLIVNSLRGLDGAVLQGCPEPRRRPQSAQKIALVLDKAPKHLQADLVALVPKLVEHSEHPLAACALLERLQKSDAEPALRIPVFGALSQLECGSEVWEHILFQSFELLADSNDEPLAATIDFIFKAASQCQHLPEAVRSVRARLKNLGLEVIFLFGEHGIAPAGLHVIDEQAFRACRHFSDIYILFEMLSIPCLAVEASQTFERAVARGEIDAQSVMLVLDSRLSQRFNGNAIYVSEKLQHSDSVVEGDVGEQLGVQRDDFTSVLGLAETLALSRDPRVKAFVKLLYTILFRWYANESYRGKMLKSLVDHATNSTDNGREVDFDLDILVNLVCEEQEIIRPVLSMTREVAELANVDRAALWHQLCASEDEIIRIREESKTEISNMAREKATISQKLSESEATNIRLKSEMKAGMDRFTREKKELSENVQEVESQLEWLRSERDDEIAKLSADKKVLQDRLHDVDTQLSQLKSRKRDELKVL